MTIELTCSNKTYALEDVILLYTGENEIGKLIYIVVFDDESIMSFPLRYTTIKKISKD